MKNQRFFNRQICACGIAHFMRIQICRLWKGMVISMKTTKELEDAVRQYQNGNTDSFDQIYELSYRYLHTCVIHVVKDEEIAADMLQETYLEISRNISQLKSAEDFLSWASTIGNRKCYAYLKKQRDVLIRSDDDQDEDAQDFFEAIADDEAFIPETVLQDREKQRLVQKIIDGLSDMQRLCIIGFYYRGQSIEEIAQELEIPANTVKSHLSRAKVKIKDAVIVLDREKGTRLYTLAPFMLLFLSKEAEACEAGPMPEALKKELDGSGVKSPGAKSKGIRKLLQSGVRYKLIAGAVLATVVIGGGAALILYANSRNAGEENPSETVLAETDAEAGSDMSADTGAAQEDNESAAQTEESTAGESETEGQEADEDAETGEQEERRMLVFDWTDYEQIGYPAGGVIPVKKDGLWGAVNYKKEEIVPCAYAYFESAPNLAGYFVLANDTENEEENAAYVYTLFASDGTKVYEGTDYYVEALGDFYVVHSMISSDLGYNNTVQRRDYYDYEGNHVLSTDYVEPVLWDRLSMGSYDGETPVRRQSLRPNEYDDAPELAGTPVVYTETGVLCADGTVRWNSGSGTWGYYDDGGYLFFRNDGKAILSMIPYGTSNHGYTIEFSYGYAAIWYDVYTEDHQYAFTLFPDNVDDWANRPDWDWDWNWESFWYDGKNFYYYGSKVVWEIHGTYLLVDLALADANGVSHYLHDFEPVAYVDWEMMLQVAEDHIPRGMVQAAYDYIEMTMNKYWLVQKGDQWGYIDHEGNEMAMYEDASSFSNGYALIVEDGTAFLINEDFEIVEECGDADSVLIEGELLGIYKDDILYLIY